RVHRRRRLEPPRDRSRRRRTNDAGGGGDSDGGAGSADCVRADANRTGPAVQQGYGGDARMVRARRLQRRHRWPGTRVRPRAHEAPRLGKPPRPTKGARRARMKAVRLLECGGQVGAYAVQLAAHAGATVIATARGDDEAYLNSIGASRVIDYREA